MDFSIRKKKNGVRQGELYLALSAHGAFLCGKEKRPQHREGGHETGGSNRKLEGNWGELRDTKKKRNKTPTGKGREKSLDSGKKKIKS